MKKRIERVGMLLGVCVLGASMMTACGGNKTASTSSTPASSSSAASSVVEESSSSETATSSASILDDISVADESEVADSIAESSSETSESSSSSSVEAESASTSDTSEASIDDGVVAGTYKAQFDMKDLLNKELSESGISLDGEIVATYVLDLSDDGKFVFNIDGETFSKTMSDAMTEQGPAIVKAMFEAEGITEESFSEIAEASGYASYDEFVAGMVEDMTNEMGGSMADEMNEASHVEGTYSVDGNKLLLTAEGEDDSTAIDNGEIQDDGSIKIVSTSADGTEIELTFTKA